MMPAFPMYVGMNRTLEEHDIVVTRVPHVRGDEPPDEVRA